MSEDDWGNDLPFAQVDEFRTALVELLSGQGYRPRPYGDGKAVAFVTEEVADREEPILIDNGGLAGCLKIAVRHAETTNRQLHEKVLDLFSRFGIDTPRNGAYQPVAEGTKVYALKRC